MWDTGFGDKMKDSRKKWLKTPAGQNYKRLNQQEYRRKHRKIHDLDCDCSMCLYYEKIGGTNPLRLC